MCGVTRMDRLRNEVMRERVDVARRVLKWFGHVERLSAERLPKRVYLS